MSCLLWILSAIVVWWFADIMSGVYHYLTDRGWNVPSQVHMFAHHHVEPEGFYPTIYSFLGAIPFLALAIFVSPVFYLLAAATALIEVPHWMAHSRVQWPVVRFLRWTGAVISIEGHYDHHGGAFDRNFCIVTNWNNWWFNKVVKLIVIPQR